MKPKTILRTGIAVLVTFFLKASTAEIAPSSSDLWDVNQNITITRTSYSESPAGSGVEAMFGRNGQEFIPNDTYAYFPDGLPEGYTHFVEWKTSQPITLRHVRLFAVGDGPTYNNEREFAKFTLKTKSSGSATFDVIILDLTPSHPYAFIDPSTYALIDQDVEAVTSQEFRAEFVQFNGHRGFDGPRIRELDAFAESAAGEHLSLTEQPQNQSVTTGVPVLLSAKATGPGTLSYQWFFNGAALTDATNTTLQIVSAQKKDEGDYYAIISNGSESISTSKAHLTVNEPPSHIEPVSDDLWDVSQGTTITASSGFHSWAGDSEGMFGKNGQDFIPDNTYTYFEDGAPDGFTHFVEWTTSQMVTLRHVRLFATGDTPLYNNEREFTKFTLKAKSPGSSSFDLTLLTLTPTHPYVFIDLATYALLDEDVTPITAREFRAEFVQFNGFRGFDGPRIRELDGFGDRIPGPELNVIEQPQSQTVLIGTPVQFSTEGEGNGLSYQWFFNGTPIPGATFPILQLPAVTQQHEGEYHAVISNRSQSVATAIAHLSVQTALPDGPSKADVFDISQGSQVTASSGISRFEGSGMFGGEVPTAETGSTIFDDGRPDGSVHFIEWKTAAPVSLEKIRLFAAGDPAIYNYEREFSKFVLKSKSSPSASDYGNTIVAFEAANPYVDENPTNRLLIERTFAPVVGQYFRAEFTQRNAGRGYDGPRVMELDGFGHFVEPIRSTIADWTFEDAQVGQAVTNVKDFSGNGHDGKFIFAAPQYVATDGSADGNISMFFPSGNGGTGSGFKAEDSIDFNPGNEFTLEVSVNPGQDNNTWPRSLITAQDAQSGRLVYAMSYQSDQRVVEFGIGDVNLQPSYVSAQIPDDGKSHHLAGVFKNQNLSIYLDKVLIESTNSPLVLGWTPGGAGRVTVGANDAGGFWFNGTIDRARISRRALSPDDFFPGSKPANPGVAVLKALEDISVAEDGNASFTVHASGPGTLTYEWSHNGQVIAGPATNHLDLSHVQVADAGTYSVKISNGDSSATSSATLTVRTDGGTTGPVITEQPKSLTLPVGAAAAFSVKATGEAPIIYQWYFNGEEISGATTSTLGLVNIQLQQAGTYTIAVGNVSGTTISQGAVLDIVPANTAGGQFLFANKAGSDVDAPVFGIKGEKLEGAAYLAQLYGAQNDLLQPLGAAVPFRIGVAAGYFMPAVRTVPGVPAGSQATVKVRVWEAAAGTTFEAAVTHGGAHGESTPVTLSLGGGVILPPDMVGLQSFSLVAPPRIVTQPEDKNAFVGDDVTLSVAATGSGTLTYQWKFKGQVLEGATAATLLLEKADAADSGEYSVTISNPEGSLTSRTAVVTVIVPDTTPPTLALTPPPLVTVSPAITLVGTITDNRGVTQAFWERNGQVVGSVTLQANGHFELSNIVLARGDNSFRVVALDAAGNQSFATATVALQASQGLAVGAVAPHQEGSKLTVPIELTSLGDVAALTFVLTYNPDYLSEPELEWSADTTGGFVQVNSTTPGKIRAAFALPGVPLPPGKLTLANITFRARSIPENLTTPLGLEVLGVYSDSGTPITSATDVLSGGAPLTVRKYKGDNNANDRLDVADVSIMLRLVTLLDPVRAWDVSGNDLNNNSDLDVGDVTKVLRAVVEIDPQPGATPGQQVAQTRQSLRATAAGPKVTLTSDKSRARAGEVIKVKASLSNYDGALSGASFGLSYDTNALRLASVSAHKTGALVPPSAVAMWNLAPAQTDYTKQAGKISVAMTSASAWSASNGDLAEFTFTVQPGATDQYHWPIKIAKIDLANGFDAVSVAGSEIPFTGRDPKPARLEGGFNASTGHFEIAISGEIGVRYLIEASEDLKTWRELEVQANATGTLQVNDPQSGTGNFRFYRATQLD